MPIAEYMIEHPVKAKVGYLPSSRHKLLEIDKIEVIRNFMIKEYDEKEVPVVARFDMNDLVRLYNIYDGQKTGREDIRWMDHKFYRKVENQSLDFDKEFFKLFKYDYLFPNENEKDLSWEIYKKAMKKTLELKKKFEEFTTENEFIEYQRKKDFSTDLDDEITNIDREFNKRIIVNNSVWVEIDEPKIIFDEKEKSANISILTDDISNKLRETLKVRIFGLNDKEKFKKILNIMISEDKAWNTSYDKLLSVFNDIEIVNEEKIKFKYEEMEYLKYVISCSKKIIYDIFEIMVFEMDCPIDVVEEIRSIWKDINNIKEKNIDLTDEFLEKFRKFIINNKENINYELLKRNYTNLDNMFNGIIKNINEVICIRDDYHADMQLSII